MTFKTPVAYVPRPQPTLGNNQLYLQQEMASISQSIKTILAAIADIQTRLTAHGI